MVSHGKDKVIQVQKPAQSLQAFQKKVASGEDIQVGYLKPILMAAGVAVLLVAGFYGYRAVTQASLEKNQVALADLQLEVTGDPGIPGSEPASPQDMEQRMRDRLPRLEALARSAPSGARAVTEAYLADWRLQLGIAGAAPASSGVWAQLRLAQKQVAMGQPKDAQATLAGLRSDAGPDQAWAQLYWTTVLDNDRLQGARDQAWKDLAEYKSRFKLQADPAMDQVLTGV